MAVGCCAKCSKFCLITFNLFFWISGCGLLFIGAWLLVDPSRLMLSKIIMIDTGEAIIRYLAYVLIGLGCLILVVGFCGCCGAIRESKCMLTTYFIFLFLILAGELCVGIYSALNHEKVLKDLKVGLKKRVQDDYGVQDHEAFTEAIDYAQILFKCCGIDGPEDYDDSKWKTDNLGSGHSVAQTCCVLSNADEMDAYKNPSPKNATNCQSTDKNTNEMYRHQMGCQEKLVNWFKQENLYITAIGCGIPGLEVLGMVITICLCVNIGGGGGGAEDAD